MFNHRLHNFPHVKNHPVFPSVFHGKTMVKSSMFDGEPMDQWVKSLFSYSFSHVSMVFGVSPRNKKLKLNCTTIFYLYHYYTTVIPLYCYQLPHDPTIFLRLFPWKFSPGFLPRPCRHLGGLSRSAASCGSSWRWPGWVKLGLPWKKSRFDHGFTMRKSCLPGFDHEKKLFTWVLPWEKVVYQGFTMRKVVYHGLTMKKIVYQGFTIRKSCLPWFDHEKKLFTMVWPWEKNVYQGFTMRKSCLPWFDHEKTLFTMVWP